MSNGQWYIFFGEDWGRHSSTGQFIAIELAKTRKVLWVNSLGIRTPRLNVSDIKRIFIKLKEFLSDTLRSKHTVSSEELKIHVITPIAIPLLKFKLIRKINKILVTHYINRKISQIGVINPIVISAGPEAVDVIDKFNAIRTVYYCADKYTEFPGQDKALVSQLETEMLDKVDITIVTSRALYSEFRNKHENVTYLPHGVDYELFRSALSAYSEPAQLELAGHKRPYIGFIGLIGPHLNYQIIKDVSAILSDATIVMIGPIEEGANPPTNNNILYLGKRTREQLPYYMHLFDVCITPYVVSERIKYANPTKIREYLAAGCPTICTPQEEAKEVSNEIHFAESGAEFAAAINNILEKPVDRESISRSVADQTWTNRVGYLIKMVEEPITC